MFIKKIKNVCLFFGVLSVIGPIFSEIPPIETPTENASPEPKTLNDALGEMKKLEERAENIKDEKEKEKTKVIKNIIKFLEEKREESLDDYIVVLEKMKNIEALIKTPSFSGEAKEIIDDLSKLMERIINIEKEEARKKLSLEELKKLSVQKLSKYFLCLVDDSTKDIFIKAIDSNSLDYSQYLSFEDFQRIINCLFIAMSENQDNISKSLTFMQNLIRKSKISDEKTLFPHYIRYPEKYSAYIQSITNGYKHGYNGKNENILNFLKKIDKIDFVQNLETASVLDSIYRFSTLKPLEMGENVAYFGLRSLVPFFIGIFILPIQLSYEYS